MDGQDLTGSGLAALNEGTLKNLVIVRLACAGAVGLTRAMLRRDLAPLVQNRLSPGEWRAELDDLLIGLLEDGLVAPHKMRLAATPEGCARASQFAGVPISSRSEWAQVRDVHLVARALGMTPRKISRRKRLGTTLGLRAAILESSLGVSAGTKQSSAALRDAVAVKAAGKKRRIAGSDKASVNRAEAAKLLRRPREFDSDAALVAELAAEQVGAVQTSAPSLRLAVLRGLLSRAGRVPPQAVSAPAPADLEAGAELEPLVLTEAERAPLDLGQFSREVAALARECAEGWPGNRRAFISHVWSTLSRERPGWALDEQTYKISLVDAHMAGLLTLGYADLRDKDNIALVQASAIRHHNTEWHFIRVED